MNFRKSLASGVAALLLLSFQPLPASAVSDTALSLLTRLTVSAESNSSSYTRASFKHWIDQDKDSCDTREEVLIAESSTQAKTGTGCKILAGKWKSLYDNRTITKAPTLDIDHFIPLKEAWESGASGWSSSDREALANDLGFKGSLIAVSASTNRSKGDRDPAQWLPPNKAYKCTYAVTWVQVKYRWSLTIDPKEEKALKSALASCPKTKKYPLPQQVAIIATPEPSESSAPSESPSLAPSESSDQSLDPRFSSCAKAKAAGYGPYVKGLDPEYSWYRDGDNDGTVCE